MPTIQKCNLNFAQYLHRIPIAASHDHQTSTTEPTKVLNAHKRYPNAKSLNAMKKKRKLQKTNLLLTQRQRTNGTKVKCVGQTVFTRSQMNHNLNDFSIFSQHFKVNLLHE